MENGNISTVISLGIAVAVYLLMIILLKIFSEEEIFMIPYGKKIYAILKKHRLYGKRRRALKQRLCRLGNGKSLQKTRFERKK